MSRTDRLAAAFERNAVATESAAGRRAQCAASALARGGLLYRWAGRVAHRVRYVPLACVLLGAVLMWLGPEPHGLRGDELGDDSMAPGIAPGQLLSVNRGAFAQRPPRIGEIVTFHPPADQRCASTPPPSSSCPFTAQTRAAGEGIKRVVAGPGDLVEILAGDLIRNGR